MFILSMHNTVFDNLFLFFKMWHIFYSCLDIFNTRYVNFLKRSNFECASQLHNWTKCISSYSALVILVGTFMKFEEIINVHSAKILKLLWVLNKSNINLPPPVYHKERHWHLLFFLAFTFMCVVFYNRVSQLRGEQIHKVM